MAGRRSPAHWGNGCRPQDPREYLAFLHQLQALPEARQRFAIDQYLKRHERALGHLLRAGMPRPGCLPASRHLKKDDSVFSGLGASARGTGDEAFDECLRYTVQHGLYQTCLHLVRADPSRSKVRAGKRAAQGLAVIPVRLTARRGASSWPSAHRAQRQCGRCLLTT